MSIHRGVVVNNIDPTGLGRMQVEITSVGVAASWALPVVPFGAAGPIEPPIGAPVWVMFENDDLDAAVVLGLVPAPVVITPVQLAAELGHDDGDRPGRRVRAFLRERYPDHPPGERWILTLEQADEVRAHFRS